MRPAPGRLPGLPDIALPKLAPDRTIRVATLPAGEDPDTLIRNQGATRFAAILEHASPISVALFGLLREAAPTETPEQRAAFRARLVGACGRIADKGLAAEYRRDLLDRYFAAFRRNSPAAQRRRAERPVVTQQGTDEERVRTLTAILLRHPALAPKLEDAFTQLPLSPAARRLVEAALAYADEAENLDFTRLIAHLTSLDLAEACAWALGDKPCPSPAYAGASATASEAEAGWWHLYGLMRGSSLEAEVATAWKRWHEQPSPANQQRWIALCAALNRWRGGNDDAMEADAVPAASLIAGLGDHEAGVILKSCGPGRGPDRRSFAGVTKGSRAGGLGR